MVRYARRSRFIASTSWNSSVLICTRRTWVAMPSSSTTANSISANAVVCSPKPLASASSATAMIEAESTVRKTAARLMASFQIKDRDASRLQCSVARMAAACGPNECSSATSAAVAAESGPARSGTPRVAWALLGSAVVMMDLLKRWGDALH